MARCPGQVEASRALLLGAVNCEQLKSARVYDWTWLHGCMETSVILTRQIDLSTGSKISSPAREFLKKPSPVCPRFTLQDSQGFATEQTGFNSSQGLDRSLCRVCAPASEVQRGTGSILSLSLAPLAQAKVYRDANKMHSKVFAVVSECGEYFLPGQDGEMYRGAHMLFCRNWWEQRKGINRGEQTLVLGILQE